MNEDLVRNMYFDHLSDFYYIYFYISYNSQYNSKSQKIVSEKGGKLRGKVIKRERRDRKTRKIGQRASTLWMKS